MEKLLKIKLVSQERAREVLAERQELDESELSYAGADENAPAFVDAGAGARGAQPTRGGGLPFAQPQPQEQSLSYSYGPGPDMDDGSQRMNREQRRRMEKKAKKKKLKI
jgi:hypothetical protein